MATFRAARVETGLFLLWDGRNRQVAGMMFHDLQLTEPQEQEIAFPGAAFIYHDEEMDNFTRLWRYETAMDNSLQPTLLQFERAHERCNCQGTERQGTERRGTKRQGMERQIIDADIVDTTIMDHVPQVEDRLSVSQKNLAPPPSTLSSGEVSEDSEL